MHDIIYHKQSQKITYQLGEGYFLSRSHRKITNYTNTHEFLKVKAQGDKNPSENWKKTEQQKGRNGHHK